MRGSTRAGRLCSWEARVVAFGWATVLRHVDLMFFATNTHERSTRNRVLESQTIKKARLPAILQSNA